MRTKILEAASQLFLEEGFENVSIRRIAEKIEYSPATIYLYFKDKAELIEAICEDFFEDLLAAITSAAEHETDPIQALKTGLRAYIEFSTAHPSHYMVLFGMPAKPAEEISPHDEGLQAFDLLRDRIRACLAAGVIAPQHVETAAQTTWMFVHGVTSLLITSHPQPGFPWLGRDHLIDSALDLLIAGLQNRSLTSPS
ncbi:MAG TPA: TetR/AcrR family transcriptional regulator [Bryobacteraceae bacterium]|nr:TetR/AcrR family transcriptional regulator [Bryobacteraceae bacterium]